MSNSAVFWKVRVSPSLAMRSAGTPVTLLPSSSSAPELGPSTPLIRLNAVVLPAPFGPIRPTISPLCTSSDSSFTATSPPKRRVTCWTCRRTGDGRGARPFGLGPQPEPDHVDEVPVRADELARELVLADRAASREHEHPHDE